MKITIPKIKPCPVVIVADSTFFSRNEGICIFQVPRLKKAIARSFIKSETAFEYRHLKEQVERSGFTILAIVIDGRKGSREVFKNIPVQMCQYHQLKIIKRYLTMNPRLEAGKELKNICKNLCSISKKDFISQFTNWDIKWCQFLKEKTYNDNGKWFYTHKKLRSARRSLYVNIPYLFTYQDYPELKIPNTTNYAESYNAKIKELTKVHRGYNTVLKHKIIDEILSK